LIALSGIGREGRGNYILAHEHLGGAALLHCLKPPANVRIEPAGPFIQGIIRLGFSGNRQLHPHDTGRRLPKEVASFAVQFLKDGPAGWRVVAGATEGGNEKQTCGQHKCRGAMRFG
jgi:hypothetical protein